MIHYPQTTDNAEQTSPAELVRFLVKSRAKATLSTTLAGEDTAYGALILLAATHDGCPILFLSDLAEHTKNFQANPRASLMVDGTDGLISPLTGPRATLVGEITKADNPLYKARFLARHPDAAMYKDFSDFSVYTMNVDKVHLVAGFGRIEWIDGADVLSSSHDALKEAEQEIVTHMNEDHADAIRLMAATFGEVPGAEVDGSWTMTGLDHEGCDLKLDDQIVRVAFFNPVSDAESARAELVRLTKRARENSIALTAI